MGNGMMCCKKIHPLMLKCFIPFLRFIRKVGGASGSIYKPFIVHMVPFSSEADSQYANKIPDLMYPLCIGNAMLYYKEGHPLMLPIIA